MHKGPILNKLTRLNYPLGENIVFGQAPNICTMDPIV
jgi:hypothetical protein